MKVLVTGASGFVGSHLVATLLRQGFEVRAAGRRPAREHGADFAPLPEVRNADWPALLTGVDAVVHLAAIAHARGVNDAELGQVTHEPVVAMCRSLEPRQRLIFISSLRAVAGPSAPHPVDDAASPHPACAYGRHKLAAERAVLEAAPAAAVLRPTTIYGEGVKCNMARLAALAHSPLPLPVAGFDAPRSYVSVQNVCSAVAFLLRRDLSGAFNVSDPDVACLRDLVLWLRQAAGAPARMFRLPDAARRLAAGSSHLKDLCRLACEPLIAPPRALLANGWLPEHASSREGVFEWARDDRGRAWA